jgi:hypothetical protein
LCYVQAVLARSVDVPGLPTLVMNMLHLSHTRTSRWAKQWKLDYLHGAGLSPRVPDCLFSPSFATNRLVFFLCLLFFRFRA